MNNRITFKLIAIFSIALFMLTACSGGVKPSKEVMKKFKENLIKIESADMSLALTVKGSDSTDKVDFNLKMDGKLDGKDKKTTKADLNLTAKGTLKAGTDSLSGDIGLALKTVGKNFYFNVTKFSSTDASAASIKTALKPYENKWQHLASDFIPKSIQSLQEKDAETLKKEKQLKDLFVSTTLFDVAKEYGVEKLNGEKMYHYGLRFNKTGLKDYIKKASEINGTTMTSAEIDNAVKFVDSITKMEVWINAKDFYVYKWVIDVSSKDATNSVTSDVSVTYTAKSYNKDLKITAPTDFSEFNPLMLLMGMQTGSSDTSSGLDTSSLGSSSITGTTDSTTKSATTTTDTTKPVTSGTTGASTK